MIIRLGKPTHLRGASIRDGWSACGVQSGLLSETSIGVTCFRCRKTKLFRCMAAFDKLNRLQRIADAALALNEPLRKESIKPCFMNANQRIEHELKRKDVLLRAAYDLLKLQKESCMILDLLAETVFYDEADCDGSCLMDDIANELGIDVP